MIKASKFIFFTLFFFALSFTSIAQSNKLDKAILDGLDLIYNFKWQDGEQAFNSIIRQDSSDPTGYYYKSSIYLWHFLSNKDPKTFERFNSLADSTIDISNKKIQANPKDESALFYLGSIYNYKAIVLAFNGNYMDAAYASKKSENYLKDVQKINPNNYDIGFGLGLYNYAVSQIPAGFRWVLSIAGINGSKQAGFKYLESAARQGKYCKVEAKYFLSQLLMNTEFNYKESMNLLDDLCRQYPENVIFIYAKSVLLMKLKRPSEARVLLLEINKTKLDNFSKTVAFTKFLLGDCYFKANNYDSAIVYYKTFLENTIDKDYKGIAAYRCGLSFDILGKREQALKFYKLGLNGNLDIEDDIFALRKCKKMISKEMNPDYKKLLYAFNLAESGEINSAENLFKKLLELNLTEEYKCEILFNLSEIALGKKDYNGCIQYVDQIVKLDAKDEQWVYPFALYQKAKAYKAQNDFINCKDTLDELFNYSEYDYKESLTNQANKLLENNK